jgi:hypothetical protein
VKRRGASSDLTCHMPGHNDGGLFFSIEGMEMCDWSFVVIRRRRSDCVTRRP